MRRTEGGSNKTALDLSAMGRKGDLTVKAVKVRIVVRQWLSP